MIPSEDDLLRDLISKYLNNPPSLFKEGETVDSLMKNFTVSVRPGWIPLLDSLFETIWQEKALLPLDVQKVIYITQVKEKFGELTVYLFQELPHMTGAIAMANAYSVHVCEKCGQPGKLRVPLRGWIKTLCEAHHQEREKGGA